MISELIILLQDMPQDAKVWMGYEGNYISTQPTGDVFVVRESDDFLYAKTGDVFIEGDR